ncbi:HNH endonuclease [Candidatus Pacearchaeota archaeon]|jgi:hypothetical protein|nr:HNH endonuclease [Candidatus Pacearchaeota archaeon]
MQSTLICENCGKTTERNSNRQRLCPECRPKVYRVRATDCERKRRKELGKAYLDYDRQIKSKPENREKQHKRQHNRWLRMKNDPVIMANVHEKQIEYNDRALNKRDFGGNWYKVYDRDGGKCQVCGSTEKICVHHKDKTGWGKPRNEKNNDMSNLILLCNSCHMKIHRLEYNMKRKKGDPI